MSGDFVSRAIDAVQRAREFKCPARQWHFSEQGRIDLLKQSGSRRNAQVQREMFLGIELIVTHLPPDVGARLVCADPLGIVELSAV